MTEEHLRESNLERKLSRIVTCPCGKQIEHRSGRRPRFRSKRCRQKCNYVEKVARGDFSPRTIALPTKLEKKNNKFNALQRAKTLSSHLIFAPADVLAVEVWGGRSWEPTVSSDGTRIEVGRLRTRALVS